MVAAVGVWLKRGGFGLESGMRRCVCMCFLERDRESEMRDVRYSVVSLIRFTRALWGLI